MAIRNKKRLRLVSRRKDKRSLQCRAYAKNSISGSKQKSCINESDSDAMTEDELLDYYLSKDDIIIPEEIWAILDRRAENCLKANNIHIPD